MIYRAYWKMKTSPEYVPGHFGYVKACSESDARRIVQENLDSAYEVIEITEAAEHMITPQSITINFRNTSEYTIF